jgi:hypothetical protein
MLRHDQFGLLHIPKTSGSVVKAAIREAVGDGVELVGPPHRVVEFSGPVICLLRHPAAWLMSFRAHRQRSPDEVIWEGMPLVEELCELIDRAGPLGRFIALAGRARVASRIWSAYLEQVDNTVVGRCEEWPVVVRGVLDGCGVKYSSDPLYVQRQEQGQTNRGVSLSADVCLKLRQDDPLAFKLGGY